MRAKKAARFLIPLYPFLAVLYLFSPRLSQPADPGITALAPVEVVAEGQRELVGVTVAPDGTVYFSDRMSGVVYRLRPSEPLAAVLTGLQRPAGLALDAEGRLSGKNALRTGDIDTALSFIVVKSRDRYRGIFNALASQLSQIDSILTQIIPIQIGNENSEFEMSRHGTAYGIFFVRDDDGIWRIEAF